MVNFKYVIIHSVNYGSRGYEAKIGRVNDFSMLLRIL